MKKLLLIIGICILAFFSCKKDIPLSHAESEMQKTDIKKPTVETNNCTDVTDSSVTLHGNVTFEGASSVIEQGFCYSTTVSTPDFGYKSKHVEVTPYLGSFEYKLTGLTPDTCYYVRAYAQNSNGTAWGDVVKFNTLKQQETTPTETDSLPKVETVDVSEITSASAIITGTVTAGIEITEWGICWSTVDNPTIFDNKISDGYEPDCFSIVLSELIEGTTYYVRAYATNSKGTAYGETISFTTISEGAIQALFSVSETKKVCFSRGNLQFQASTNTWRFAENQWDYVGNGNLGNVSEKGVYSNNNKISAFYDGWIDLFCWGTSGWNSGAYSYQPYSHGGYTDDYYPGGNWNNSLIGTFANADWGMYNAISNGGNFAGIWRTLTKSEWTYLFFDRVNAEKLYSQATIQSVRGIVILPDTWRTPIQCKFTPCTEDWTTNNYSATEWEVMQLNGAVFLPAAGYSYTDPVIDGTVSTEGLDSGYYWSSSSGDSMTACCLHFYTRKIVIGFGGGYRCYGYSVRLVQDIK